MTEGSKKPWLRPAEVDAVTAAPLRVDVRCLVSLPGHPP
jgi:hypothetical protein